MWGLRYEIKPQWVGDNLANVKTWVVEAHPKRGRGWKKDASSPKKQVVSERKRREEVIRLMMNEKCKEKVELACKFCSNIKQTTCTRHLLETST